MSEDSTSPLHNVIHIDDERVKSHLDRVVRSSVEGEAETAGDPWRADRGPGGAA